MGVAIDALQMEIDDLTNNLEMRFLYRGFGLGVGSPTFALESDWKRFDTNLAIRLTDFAGFARHTSALAPTGGPSIDIMHLLGPWHSAGANTVLLEYSSLFSGPSIGAGVGTTVGTFTRMGPPTPT